MDDNSNSLRLQLPDYLQNLEIIGKQDVHVFILDTLPKSWEDWKRAYPMPPSTSSEEGRADGLLGKVMNQSDFDDSISFNPDEETQTLEYLSTGKDHETWNKFYANPIAAHGVMVASFIRDLAPEAHLHVIRVMNDNGVGSLLKLAEGLKHVDDCINNMKKPPSKVIVNMSLMFALADLDVYSSLHKRISSSSPVRTEPFHNSEDDSLGQCLYHLRLFPDGEELSVADAVKSLQRVSR